MRKRIEKFSFAPNMMRVVCTMDERIREPSCMVEDVPEKDN